MGKQTLKAAVIITAAGSSQRMETGTKKEFLTLNNQPVLLLSLKPFVNSNLFSNYVIVLPELEIKTGQNILSSLDDKLKFIYASGGATRQESVYNGLLALESEAPDIVLIHDGARPWISKYIIKEVHRESILKGAAIPVVASVNAMKFIDSSGKIITNLKREFTVAAQTPQGFNYTKILNSHTKAQKDNSTYIDDAEIYSKYAGDVSTVPGDTANRKITYLSDIHIQGE
ncbi:MAG: IspD/TarI family cytidylyltransferase [Spirochaetia bacterium]|nr:IspD/TarI family cytidylyltransferase [Spirochaetia bacterium]